MSVVYCVIALMFLMLLSNHANEDLLVVNLDAPDIQRILLIHLTKSGLYICLLLIPLIQMSSELILPHHLKD